jgi:predicted nucleic acid-binding protein
LILDTNALSALAEGDAALIARLAAATTVALPVVVVGEYRFGIGQSRHRARYERWLTELMESCEVLSIDETTAAQYAAIRSELREGGKPIPTNDLWIAALSRQYGYPLLSRDGHFDGIKGLRRVGW